MQSYFLVFFHYFYIYFIATSDYVNIFLPFFTLSIILKLCSNNYNQFSLLHSYYHSFSSGMLLQTDSCLILTCHHSTWRACLHCRPTLYFPSQIRKWSCLQGALVPFIGEWCYVIAPVLDVFIAAEVTLFQGHFSDRARKSIFKNPEFILVFLIQYQCYSIFAWQLDPSCIL